MIFTDDDMKILLALLGLNYGLSAQVGIAVGIGSRRRSPAVIRRRIRKHLLPAGFVAEVGGRAVNQAACYCLGQRGFEAVADYLGVAVSDLPVSTSTKKTRVRSWFSRHHVAANWTRLAIEEAAAAPGSPILIEDIIPEWEVYPGKEGCKVHHEKFVLSERFVMSDGKVAIHRPDYAFVAVAKDAAEKSRTLILLEQDRSTQSVQRQIKGKLFGLLEFHRRAGYVKAFDANAMRCIFVISDSKSRARIRSMQSVLERFVLSVRSKQTSEEFKLRLEVAQAIRFTRADELSAETFLDDIWEDWQGYRRPFFVRSGEPEAA